MKISKISIKNYRSCVDTVFEPHESLSALIGPNGSGKTNILSAIRLLPALCRHRGSTVHDAPSTSLSEIKTWYELDGKKIIHTAKINLVTNEKNQDEIIAAHEDWYMYDFTKSRSKLSIPSWILFDIFQDKSVLGVTSSGRRARHLIEWVTSQGIDSKVVTILEDVIRVVNGISYYSASQFTNPGSSPISFEVESEGDSKRRTGISISGHKRFLYDIYKESRKPSQKYAEFMGLIGQGGIGLVESIDFNEVITSTSNYSVMTGGKVVKKEKTNLLVVPSFNIAGNSLSPSQLSEGTFKTLALVFYLVTDTSSVLMVEEPEVCVHHGLLASIVELIKIYSKDKQIFVSTHSDSVLDKLEIQNVFKVRRDKGTGTSVSNIKKSLKSIELAALKNYLLNEGSLGEYWKHGDLENV